MVSGKAREWERGWKQVMLDEFFLKTSNTLPFSPSPLRLARTRHAKIWKCGGERGLRLLINGISLWNGMILIVNNLTFFETIFFGIDFILFFYFERENIWDIIRDIRIELVSYRIMRYRVWKFYENGVRILISFLSRSFIRASFEIHRVLSVE